MVDIVERLRDDANAWVLGRGGALSKEAADEIERLREEIERLCGSGEIAQKPSEYRKDKERER